MQSSVEHVEGLEYKVIIEEPAANIDSKVEARLKEVRPRVRLDGFRPGKVPLNVVRQRYAPGIRQEIIEEAIEQRLRKVFEESEKEPAGSPTVSLHSGMRSGEDLKFEARFEVVPEVEVKALETLEVSLPTAELSEKDVDEMLNTLRRQQARFERKEGAAEESDRVTVDFVGTLNGEAFEGGSGEDARFVLGSGQILPDFENNLKGRQAGEEIAFDVRFPEGYHAPELAGKITQFTATIKAVEKMVLPELDQAFIVNFGVKEGTMEAFRKAVADNMRRELGNALRRIRRARLFDAILEKNAEQVIPEVQVREEIARMSAQMKLEKQIPDPEKREEFASKAFDEQARRRVRMGLLLGKLFQDSKIELDQGRVKERLDAIAATYEDPDEVRAYYRHNEQARRDLESSILEEQLVDQIYTQVQVQEEAKNFQEVMALNSELGY